VMMVDDKIDEKKALIMMIPESDDDENRMTWDRGCKMKMLPGSRGGNIDRQDPLPIPSHTGNPVLPTHFLLWVIQSFEIVPLVSLCSTCQREKV
jgi:hypothetical protein